MDIYINELSYKGTSLSFSNEQAREKMQEFIGLLAACKKKYSNAEVCYDESMFTELQFNSSYKLSDWMKDYQIDKSQLKFLLVTLTKTPFLTEEEIIETDIYSLSCKIHGIEAKALLAAYVLNGITLSLKLTDKWDNPIQDAILEKITIEGDIHDTKIEIRNVSEIAHLSLHDDYFKNAVFTELNTYSDLWDRKESYFSKLQFCESTKKNLKSLEKKQFIQVRNKLYELDHYMKNSYDGTFDENSIPGKITPDSKETLDRFSKERTFLCPDNVERTFSWHMRATPGAIRLYFEIDSDVMYVGYIGKKLPTVDNPKGL